MRKEMSTTQKDYDYAPLPSRRVMANFLRWKIMPFGFIERGPGIVWLISIWLRHRFGAQLAHFRIRHKKQYDRMIFIRHKLLGLIRR